MSGYVLLFECIISKLVPCKLPTIGYNKHNTAQYQSRSFCAFATVSARFRFETGELKLLYASGLQSSYPVGILMVIDSIGMNFKCPLVFLFKTVLLVHPHFPHGEGTFKSDGIVNTLKLYSAIKTFTRGYLTTMNHYCPNSSLSFFPQNGTSGCKYGGD